MCMCTALAMATCNSVVRFGIMIAFTAVEKKSTLNSLENSTSNAYNLFNFVQTVIQGVHVLEYIVLFWSLCQFHQKLRTSEGLKQEIKSLTQCHDIKITRHCLKKFIVNFYDNIFLIIFLVLLYPTIILLPVILYAHEGGYSSKLRPVYSRLYIGTLFVDFISFGIVRIIMITVSLLVKRIWKAACVQLQAISSSDGFTHILTAYDEAGELISPLQDIFQKWFVLQWIVNFVAITQFCMLFFDEQVQDIDKEPYLILDESAAFHFTILLFYITSLAIPYFCGISMNSYHEAYLQHSRVQQKGILSGSPPKSVSWIMQNAKLVPKNAKYQFVPSLGGLTIPLSSTGHNLTIAMALLVFWLSLVSKWVSKDT